MSPEDTLLTCDGRGKDAKREALTVIQVRTISLFALLVTLLNLWTP